jgi:hypothetical protein
MLVDSLKCNGPKSLSRRRSFLSVMLLRFSDSAGSERTSQGQSFLDSQAPTRPSFVSCHQNLTFLSITEPGRPNRLLRVFVWTSSVCCLRATSKFLSIGVWSTHALPASFYMRRVLRHSSSILSSLAEHFETHNLQLQV